jgi:hypothetical protein
LCSDTDNIGIWDDTFNIDADSDPWFYIMAPNWQSDYFVMEVCVGNQRPEGNKCQVDSHRVGAGGCEPTESKPGFPLDVCFKSTGGKCNPDTPVGCTCEIGGSPDCVWQSLYDHAVGKVVVLPALELSPSSMADDDLVTSATVKFAPANFDMAQDVLGITQPIPLGFTYR